MSTTDASTIAARASAPAHRLDFVDGLRGFACLYVVLYHLFLLWPVASHVPSDGIQPLQVLTRFAAYGHIGVDVFLALSGFCLFYPLCRRAPSGANSVPALALRTYAQRRVRRILPPYLVALVLFSVIPMWSLWATFVHPAPTAAELITHLALIHNLFPETILQIDGPLWSLALEAQLYVAFPFLVLIFKRLGPVSFAATVFAVCAAVRLLAWGPLGVSSASLETQFVIMASLPARVFEFAAGMLAAYLMSRQRTSAEQVRLRLAMISVVIASMAVGYAADKMFGEHSPVPSMAWGVLAFGLLVGAGSGVLGPLERLFSWRPLVAVGLASYSIYLIHEPLLRFSGAVVGQLGLAPAPALALFVFAVGPLLLVVTTSFWYAFERPFLANNSHRTHVSPSDAGPPRRDASESSAPLSSNELSPVDAAGIGWTPT